MSNKKIQTAEFIEEVTCDKCGREVVKRSDPLYGWVTLDFAVRSTPGGMGWSRHLCPACSVILPECVTKPPL